MDDIKKLIENFKGELYDLCFEILKNTSDQEASFEYTCKNLLKTPKNGTIDIQKYFTQDEIDTYEALYSSTINGLIKMCVNKCNLGVVGEDLFYSELWKMFCNNFTTDKELAFAFYCTVIDQAIPYQYLGRTISMSNERFKEIMEQNQLFIDKIKYIERNRCSQRTEDASLVLNCLDEIEDREVKAVVLSYAILALGSTPSPLGRGNLDQLIQAIDQKIKKLEIESKDEPELPEQSSTQS